MRSSPTCPRCTGSTRALCPWWRTPSPGGRRTCAWAPLPSCPWWWAPLLRTSSRGARGTWVSTRRRASATCRWCLRSRCSAASCRSPWVCSAWAWWPTSSRTRLSRASPPRLRYSSAPPSSSTCWEPPWAGARCSPRAQRRCARWRPGVPTRGPCCSRARACVSCWASSTSTGACVPGRLSLSSSWRLWSSPPWRRHCACQCPAWATGATFPAACPR
mmetsp:Transcript_23670/g.64213  ORF Transcript_23670/g.64213 Transcript_23670/m.64213 type:complete len:217 (-) Transcript_23670:465-1115(-)